MNFCLGIGGRRLLRVARAYDMGLEIVAHGNGNNLFALARLNLCILTIKRAFVLAAAQVGHANA